MLLRRVLSFALASAASATLAACEPGAEPPAPAAAEADLAVLASRAGLNTEQHKLLAQLHRTTAPFHNLRLAEAAGYTTMITGCMVDPQGSGAMGFHLANPQLIDQQAEALAPELLVYEPKPGGTLQLVAVEYIVPLPEGWETMTPPSLFGQEFGVNETFGIWALHVWLWKDNPAGLFADWNPRASCRHASH